MKKFIHFAEIICILAAATFCRGDDVVVQMFSKKILNQISDSFISYSVDPNELLAMYKTNRYAVGRH